MAKKNEAYIEFKARTDDFQKGIKEMNAQLKNASNELRLNSTELKGTGNNVELLTKRQNVLQQELEASANKVELTEKALAECKATLGENSKEYQNLNNAVLSAKNQQAAIQNELTQTAQKLQALENENKQAASSFGQLEDKISKQETELKDLKQAYANIVLEQGKDSDEAKKLSKNIEDLSSELVKNQKAMKDAENAADNFDKTLDNVDDALDDVDESVKTSGDGFTVLKGTLANLVTEGFNKAVDAAKDFAKNMIGTAAEVKAENAQFEQTFGNLSNKARQTISDISEQTGIVDTRLQSTASNIYAFARSSGASTEQAMQLMKTSLMAAADSAAYYDKSLEDSADTLQRFLKGNFANDAALGVSATEFTRNAAATKLFGKEYKDLSEIQKQQTLLKMVTDAQKVSGAMGQAARESDGWDNVQGNLNETFRQFQAEVGTPVLENLIPVVQEVTEEFKGWADGVDWEGFGAKIGDAATKAKNAFNGIKEAFEWIKDNKAIVITAVTGLAAGFVALESAQIAAGIATAAQTAKQLLLNVAMNANPIGLVIMGITAFITAIMLLWKNCESFRNFFINIWEGIKTAFSAVVEWFRGAIQSIGTFFTGLWETVKNVFNTIKNVIKVALMFVVELIKGFFNLITLPFRLIWENCKEKVIEIFNKIKEFISDVIDKIKDVVFKGFEVVKEHVIKPINEAKAKAVEIFNAIKEKISSKIEEIKTKVAAVFNVIKEKISAPIQSAKEKVTSIFGEIYNAVLSKINAIKSKVTSVFNSVKTAIETPINKARDTVKSALDKIKGFFDGLKLKFPNIKLPHFKITGKFSLDPPSVPKLKIDWYANGGLFDKPTILPNLRGFNGFGEAGKEYALPLNERTLTPLAVMLNKLQNNGNIADILTSRFDRAIDVLSERLEHIEAVAFIDGQTASEKLAGYNDDISGQRTALANRGLAL